MNDSTYLANQGDTLASIAQAHGVSLADLQSANPLIDGNLVLEAGQDVVIPAKTVRASSTGDHAVYKVKEGETFNKIALDFSLNISQLASANPELKDPSHLSAGQEIFIPKNADAHLVHEQTAE